MKKIALAASAVVVGALQLSTAGIAAAAPDVVGQTYSDAVSAIEEDGADAKVAVTVGDKLGQDDCIVTNAWDSVWVRDVGDAFEHASDEVMLSLNCAGGYATATNPGPSSASPEAKAVKTAEAEEEAAAAEEEEVAEE